MMLHGWACDSHDWSWQLPLFESKYRVVDVDLRGHGRSDAPPTGYTPRDFAADVESLITTQYPGQQFVLVGHSMGGQVAAILGAKRPDLVKAIVSVDGTLGVPLAAQPVYEQLDAALKAGNPGDIIPPLFGGLYSTESDPGIIRWQTRRIQGMQAYVLRQSIGPLFLGPDQVAMGPNSEALCRSLKMPVYAMHRSQDRVNTVAPWFTAPKSKSELWQGPGHWIMLDRKDAFNAAVTAWIDAL
ncbi:pimeloyl-ACP methyl ester carboxylesterase [Variovorax boronicumulans]|uniref:alpha/beta fold hydrolase n=1 Tax=Variovorax boronicumulans TaxID=436515 RepID=UPI00277E50F7|nr:alpha/beta hydrolase [Variovorax boronicumulans]MDP9995154.1 pimeloyl-ACP methyl ester carboxylesterase [Variovorax boronicumulans]MDQ0006444.1 pimeloyl-ACP methyl ester carboxylesterase [Variovorax boronicumulans]